MDYSVEFFDDAAAFLECAGERLAADPLTATIVASNAERIRAATAAGEDPAAGLPFLWFAVVRDAAGDPAGLAMRNAGWAPFPPYLMPMEPDAARALAEAVLRRGEDLAQVNGARPAVDAFAAAVVERLGGSVELRMGSALYELGTLVEPRPASGRLRRAKVEEAETVREWHGRFFREAEVQADRDPANAPSADHIRIEELEQRIEAGGVWWWVDGAEGEEEPVQLTEITDPTYGAVRITLVSTPLEHRGHGYAAAAVAEVSRSLQQRGLTVTLDADLANPVSNHVYRSLGFEVRAEYANLLIRPRGI